MYAGTAMTLRGQHGLADCAMGPLLRCELAGRWPDQHVSHIQSQPRHWQCSPCVSCHWSRHDSDVPGTSRRPWSLGRRRGAREEASARSEIFSFPTLLMRCSAAWSTRMKRNCPVT